VSFDLGVWYAPGPVTHEQATHVYDLLCADQNAGLTADTRLERFYANLIDRFPLMASITEMTDEDDEFGAWSVEPTIVRGALLLNLRWPRVSAVRPVVEELAEREGLVVFDPQRNRVRHPTDMGVPILGFCGGALDTIVDPSPEEMDREIGRLRDKHNYLVLEGPPDHYVQAAHGSTAGSGDIEGMFAVVPGWFRGEPLPASDNQHRRCGRRLSPFRSR